MFVSVDRACQLDHLAVVHSEESQTFSLNIRLMWKNLLGANSLAHLAVVSVTMTLAPGFLLTRELELNGVHLGADL